MAQSIIPDVKIFQTTNQVMTYLKNALLTEVPHYDRWGLYPQALIIVACLVYFRLWWPPIPTVAIGILGVVAVIMTVRADKFSHGERAIYVMLAFSLFVVEMEAVYKDRDQHDKEQAKLRIEETEARKKESDSFAALIN